MMKKVDQNVTAMKNIESLDDCFDLVTDPVHKKNLVKFLNSPMGVWVDVSEIFSENALACVAKNGLFFALWTHPFDQSILIHQDDDYRLVLFAEKDLSEILSATTNYSYWSTI